MSVTVCLGPANTLAYPKAGGYLWIHLNWALGLRALGCRVIWLDGFDPGTPAAEMRASVAALQENLTPYGLADSLAVCSWDGEPLPPGAAEGCLDLDAASEADLLINFRYITPPEIVGRFRRSALVDIDPGLLQTWVGMGGLRLAPHDAYFTIGETVGQPGTRFPDLGLRWQYTPPCVALDWWPEREARPDAPFTTVSNWYMDEFIQDADGTYYRNDKLTGFQPFLDLPSRTDQPLELALCLAAHDDDYRADLRARGWRVRDAWEIVPTPRSYQRYVQDSRGEFSCAKPGYVRLQTAWLSDRTICYLASGKPAVVQHTGASRILPDAAGLFRFRDVDEAARQLEAVAADYDRHSRLARALAEERFDARKVVGSVLERALR
jgi:hypothetical protein